MDIIASAKQITAVTPHDTTELVFNALYIGVSGDVTIEGLDGTSVTFVGVLSGTILPVRGIGVDSTGTDALSIVSLNW